MKKIFYFIPLLLLSCATMAKNNGNPLKFKHSERSFAAFDTERLARLDTVFQDLVRRRKIFHAKETIFFVWLLKPKLLPQQVC